VLGYLALWLALAAIAWFRLDAVARGTIWAEDGRNFLQGALDGVSLFHPYAGYEHVVPRAIAALVVAVVPIEGWAIGITVLTTAVTASVGALVYGVTASLPLSRLARLALAALTVLTPALASEVLGNSANLHTVFLWLAPWLFLARPRSWWSSAGLAVVAFLTTATEIQMLLFAPLLLLRIRDRRRWPLAGGAVAGLVLQIVVTVAFPRPTTDAVRPSLASVTDGFALQVGGGMWLSPLGPLLRLVADHGWWVAYVTLIPVLVVGIVAVATRGANRWLILVLLLAAPVLWTAGFLLNTDLGFDYAAFPPDRIATISTLRYAVAPSMLFLAVLVLAVDRWARRAPGVGGVRRGIRVGGAVVVGASVVVALVLSADGSGESRKSGGPVWAESIAVARADCAEANTREISLQTAPARPTWQVTLSCDRLR
jgi:hypothetical protein